MKPLFFALVLLILCRIGNRADEKSSPTESVLVFEGAAPGYSVEGSRYFRRNDGDGFLRSFYTSGGFYYPATWRVNAHDKDGKWEWTHDSGGRARGDFPQNADAVIESRSGGFLFAKGGDLSATKWAPNLGIIWSTKIFTNVITGDAPFTYHANQVRELSDGSVVVLGSQITLKYRLDPPGRENFDMALARISRNGRLSWKTFSGGPGKEYAAGLVELPDGSLLIGGASASVPGEGKSALHYGEDDIWIARHRPDGSRDWDQSFGGDRGEALHSMQTNRLGVVLFGTSQSGISGNKATPGLGDTDLWIVQVDGSGVMLREAVYGTKFRDSISEVFPLKDGGWLLQGEHLETFPFPGPGPGGPAPEWRTVVICLNEDLSERWTLKLPRAGVTPTRSGDIRVIADYGYWRFGEDRFVRQMLIAPGGSVLTEQVLQVGAFGSHFNGMGLLMERSDGNFLSTDGTESPRFRTITQPRGTPVFHITEVSASEELRSKVSILSTFTNGAVFYTTNITEPSSTSQQYTGPFQLHRSAHVRAIAYDSAFSRSATNSVFVPARTQTLTIAAGQGGVVRLERPLSTGGSAGSSSEVISNSVPQAREVLTGKSVQLLALPEPGAEFIRWEGDLQSTSTNIAPILDRSFNVRAIFGARVETSGRGGVLVDGFSGSRVAPFGERYLQAVPNDGYYFAGWGGGLDGLSNPRLFAFRPTNDAVSAFFSRLAETEAAPIAVPLGPGDALMEPQKNVFARGEKIRIEASARPGAMFLGWSGGTNATSRELFVTAEGTPRFYALFAGATTNGFSAALPKNAADDVVRSSTNLVDWAPVAAATNHPGILLINEPSGPGSRFYRVFPAE